MEGVVRTNRCTGPSLHGSVDHMPPVFSGHIVHDLLQPFLNRTDQDTPPSLCTEDQMRDKKLDTMPIMLIVHLSCLLLSASHKTASLLSS